MNLRGFLLVDAELLREAERRQAVDDAEVDGLGGAAMLGVLRHGPDAENFLGGARVNVLAGAKCFDQHGVLGEMREDAQLDLRIVGGEQRPAGIGDERGANLAAELGAHGNILQVGIGGTEAARGRAGLAEARVQAAGCRLNQFRQRVHVGGFELGDFAVFENFARQFVQEREFVEHVGGGGARFGAAAPAGGGEIHLVEKNFGELLRRIDVEFRAGQFPDAFFERADFASPWIRTSRRALRDRRERRARSIAASTGASGRSISS